MNPREHAAGPYQTYRQEIAVPFGYPVCFTRAAFDPANPLVADVLRPASGPPARALAYLDAGLVAAHPYLPRAVVAYARRHRESLELAAEPRVLPGGEAAKDGWGVARGAIDEIVAHRLCRQSFVLAVGGGAMLDAVGFAEFDVSDIRERYEKKTSSYQKYVDGYFTGAEGRGTRTTEEVNDRHFPHHHAIWFSGSKVEHGIKQYQGDGRVRGRRGVAQVTPDGCSVADLAARDASRRLGQYRCAGTDD